MKIDKIEGLKVALLGNPNSGKTTLFNNLTGSRAHVGNWPGVTIDKKQGVYKKTTPNLILTDLPGIYSLSPYTPEEVITRKFLLDEKPDVVINIVDATNLERNLYLTTQLMEIDIPVVVALNMIDVVEKRGDDIDAQLIEETFNVPVVKISALKNKGTLELVKKVISASYEKRAASSILLDGHLKDLILKTEGMLQAKALDNSLFHAIKLIEQDELEVQWHEELKDAVDELRKQNTSPIFENDFEAIIADSRYCLIKEKLKNSQKRSEKNIKNGMTISKSDKVDKVLTSKYFGIPIFLFVIFAVFHMTFSENFLFLKMYNVNGGEGIPSLGVWLQGLVERFVEWVSDKSLAGLESASPWASGLVVNGLIAGVGAVLSFLPQILLMFLFISILEDTGYMARAAFLLDRILRKFGLSGKSFLPMVTCFGCTVPGILATRTLITQREKVKVIAVSPFFSCGAKLPIWTTFASIYWSSASGRRGGDFVVFGMYILGIAVAILAAIAFKKLQKDKSVSHFIMELPEYRMPQLRNTLTYLWDKLRHYLFRAATVIAASVLILWFLTNFGWEEGIASGSKFAYLGEENEYSMLAYIARGIRYIFVPLGFASGEFGWQFVISALTGLLAKEMVVATLGVFSSTGGGIEVMLATLSVPGAISFMAFNLLTIPCLATVAAARAELKNKKQFWAIVAFWLLASYAACLVIYWGLRYPWVLAILILAAILGVQSYKLYKTNKKKKEMIRA